MKNALEASEPSTQLEWDQRLKVMTFSTGFTSTLNDPKVAKATFDLMNDFWTPRKGSIAMEHNRAPADKKEPALKLKKLCELSELALMKVGQILLVVGHIPTSTNMGSLV